MPDPTGLEKHQRGSGLERVPPQSEAGDFFEIPVPNRPAPFRIEYAAIRELQRQLAGEGESVGLLLGSSSPDALSMRGCEVLNVAPAALADPKMLPAAFSQSVKALAPTAADAPQLLGCFRTQVGGWPGMRESDLGMARRTFPGSDSFFLLIRTTRHRPWLAALYSLDPKTTTISIEPVLEFPFDEYLLRKGYLTDLIETPERVEVPQAPRKLNTRWMVTAGIVAVLLAGSAAAYKFRWIRFAGQEEGSEKNAGQPSALSLKVNRSGKDFEVSWDRLSPAVQQSSSATLTISDGAITRTVALGGPQLREGRILYTPLFEELNFRLEVTTPSQGTAAESVQVLAWSGKQPAELLSAASPDPLAGSPAPNVPTRSPLPPTPLAAITAPKVANVTPPKTAVRNEPQQAKAAKAPVTETAAVIQPPPVATPGASTAPTASAKAPEPSPRPVVAERPPAVQPTQPAAPPPSTSPSSATPSQPPAVAAPKQETQPAPVPATPPATVPTVPSNPTPAPAAATSAAPHNVVLPVPIQRVAPVIPRGVPTGAAAGVQRVISVRAMVDSAGSVQNAEVIATTPKGAFGEALMKSAALDAARKWKFRPGQLNGKNVAAEYTIDFRF